MKNVGLLSQLIATGVFLLAVLVFALFHINPQPTPSLTALTNKAYAASDSREYKLNINTASAEELTMLPGVGEKIAQRIVEYREENGPYASVDDIMQVKGVKQTLFNDISDYITIGG